jgi:pSer/pThr/pTyr-binding forkhead associated (FHA) protein
MVTLREGRWWIRDEGSTNGTLVNGERINSERALREGDELQIGGVRLRMAR